MPSASAPVDFQEPTVVQLTDEERTTGELSLENLGIAISAMHRDGLVVLENAVDTAHMDTINGILVKEAEEMAKMPSTHFNEVSSLPSATRPYTTLTRRLPELSRWPPHRQHVPGPSARPGPPL